MVTRVELYVPAGALYMTPVNPFLVRTCTAMITTVIFDLDDTLYDEIDYCRSGFAAVARHLATLSDTHSPDGIFAALWQHFTSGNRRRSFNAAMDDLDLRYDHDLIQQLVAVYRTHVPQLTLPSETRSVLDDLKPTHALALLSDGFLPAQKLKVRALGLADYFEVIIFTEELGHEFWKPSPRGFERLIDMLDVPPKCMAYVADNEMKDFIAPNVLGMLTIQVLRPARLHTESCALPSAAANHKIRKISELPPVLRQA